MNDKARVQALLEQADKASDMAREFRRLTDFVAENDVPEVYLALVESAGKQVGETLGHVSRMVDMLQRMSRPDRQEFRTILCSTREVNYFRDFWKSYA